MALFFAPRIIAGVGEARTCASDITTASSLVDKVKEQNGKEKVVVYSKSYCPYCARVKGLFKELNVDFKLFELDQMADGQEVQDALYDVSGSRTVPQVFVNGAYIGGADDTHTKYRSGELKKIFGEAGVTANL
ncbi:g175 [Coccomyxa elongata]